MVRIHQGASRNSILSLEPSNRVLVAADWKQTEGARAVRTMITTKTTPLLLIASIAVIASGCQSAYERHHLVCAQFEARQITLATAMQRLGLTNEHSKKMQPDAMVDEYCDALD